MIPSFLFTKLWRNSPFFSPVNTYEKNFESEEYYIAHQDYKICLLLNYRYHVILSGDYEELLQKLDAFCFNYQPVDCLYTLFKYPFCGKNDVQSGQLFDNLQRAIHFNQQIIRVDRLPSIPKKILLRRSTKEICWAPSKKLSRRKLVLQYLQTEMNKSKTLNSS